MPNKYFITITFLLAGVLVYTSFLSTVHPVPLNRSLSEFPDKIGAFSKFNSQKFSEEVEEGAGMDNYLMSRYRNAAGYELWLYVGYYEEQSEGSIIHSPKHCLPGGGWSFIGTGTIKVKGVDEEMHSINRATLQKVGYKQLVHYWYHSRGRIVANEYIDKFWLIFDSIFKKRSDGSLIRITGDGQNETEDIQQQLQFIDDLIPVIDAFLPR